MLQRKVTYRLNPNATQAAALDHQRWVHCLLWNQALDERRRAWAERQASLGFAAQCKELTRWRAVGPLLCAINALAEQVTLKRLDLAFQHFFRRVKNGETPGFPRFQPLHRFTGWEPAVAWRKVKAAHPMDVQALLVKRESRAIA